MTSKVIPLSSVSERAKRVLILDGGLELETVLEQCHETGVTSIVLCERPLDHDLATHADVVVQVNRTELDRDSILSIARLTQADAIHMCSTPWVDDEAFRAACVDAGIVLFDCAVNGTRRR